MTSDVTKHDTMAQPISFLESLASMKRWQSMLALIENLATHPDEVADVDIEATWNDFHDSLRTNCDAAAEALMAALSSICYHRPYMVEKMLSGALEPLFMLGYEDAASVISWAKRYSENLEPYMGRPDDAAINWIEKTFCHADAAIEAALLVLQEDE